ncbi:MAG: Mrp/NBP35 family ATP-binding protein [Anaerolineae bacterium]|nr:Mrp/NBP35 family ATP-binding protein [Anaerolineae bacterium]
MSEKDARYEAVMQALSTVIEPELKRDIVSLKMVEDLRIEGDVAHFRFVLTTPACPLRDVIYEDARAAVTQVEGIRDIEIEWASRVPTDRRIHGTVEIPVRNTIAITSGKGGVGKSTVATNLAVALAQSGARVGLMDADILGPNLPTMVGLPLSPPRVVTVDGKQKMQPHDVYGLQVISMGFLMKPGQPLMWRGPMLHTAIRQFLTDVNWNELDYLIADLPPGTGDAQISLAQSVPLTGGLIVTQPQAVAVEDATKALVMFQQLEVPILGVIENMSGAFFGEGGGERLAAAHGVPSWGASRWTRRCAKAATAGGPWSFTTPKGRPARRLPRSRSRSRRA